MDRFLAIGLGGFLGANTRYWVTTWAAERWGATFPFGTLLINVAGSFLLGLFLAATTQRIIADPRWRAFFTIGFLGAFTTFSAFTYESAQLLMGRAWWPGLGYLFANNAVGLAACVLGILLGRGR